MAGERGVVGEVFPVTRRENAVPLLRRRSSLGGCTRPLFDKRVRVYVQWPLAIESGPLGIFNVFDMFLENLEDLIPTVSRIAC